MHGFFHITTNLCRIRISPCLHSLLHTTQTNLSHVPLISIHPHTHPDKGQSKVTVCLHLLSEPNHSSFHSLPPMSHRQQLTTTALPGATIAPSSRTAPRAPPTGTLSPVDPHPSRLLWRTAPVGGRLPSPYPLPPCRWSSPAAYRGIQPLRSVRWSALAERARAPGQSAHSPHSAGGIRGRRRGWGCCVGWVLCGKG